MRKQDNLFQGIDWILVGLYALLVIMGWLNIYSAVYNEDHQSIFDMSQSYGRQLLFIITAFVIILLILLIDGNFFTTFAYGVFALLIILLIFTLVYTTATKGAHSWFKIGSFKVQPSEFSKFATALALSKFLSQLNVKMQDVKTRLIAFTIIGIPAALILLQNDTGSTLVFGAFILVLYREGLNSIVLLVGLITALLFVFSLLFEKNVMLISVLTICFLVFLIMRKKWSYIFAILGVFIAATGLILSVNFIFNKLQPHQRNRIDVLLGKKQDLKGVGYNVNQSLIAFGSGGFIGKGFLQGTQTKYNFVPEQSTDFIFCTVGEEWGFVGCAFIILLFVALLVRILIVAERQRSAFSRIYGYAVACILFIHVLINIGMAIGLAPVIGIPLPFFSYGGSSLWAFTILLFIFIKLDAYRLQLLR